MFEHLNSPIQKIELPPFERLFVKRDDLIDPYISGNKWRKLKYILKEAQNQNRTHLVTFGGAYSNHLVATAALASRKNLKATAFVRGEEVTNQMLLLCKLYGMDLIFVDREAYKNKIHLFDTHFETDKNAYFIDEGGACLEATLGCEEIIDELDTTYDHIFCAAGTGTTASGLLNGIYKNNLKTKLHIIPVLKGGDFIAEEIKKYSSISNQLILHTDYHFGGYAKTTPELITFIKDFTAKTGMLIDPVYTAKMFFAIKDLAEKQIINNNDKILAIHTGGLLGMFGMMDKF
ncbi:1-aminocyclopropane-1-carboxylate deaminase/D-cysteine desulfhydrase [Pedobacter changchengzhani]|uniref:1-aminocyclopropane-1-carboxylate deaminase/D-cysteine desulfhydrase n=1 Tax=Pedobacter changchengzhani TaxID=2529274 RepID=A0A4R5MM65_9SPHI|nr:pyridoxal-phosphate dependent enzyme [Pedobacter changchengzhani]TDG36606.1 1-aminocyclopropane-1-carboxylate deaminase/D-cysteine desulfhydrase [Pedobacter changchengzhani]